MKIQKEISKIEVFPGEAQEIDERLDILFKLKRKYGGSIQSVIEFYQNANEKLRRIRSSEEQAAFLSKRKDELREILCVKALELSVQRQATASILETSICNELQELGMKNIKFLIKIEHQQNPDSFPVNGLDHVEFLISPNAGEDLKPLSRIASGGEASRIMLAIKTILAQSDRIPLLIFDEVDTGISGRTAGLLGEKLLKISNNHQVLCVTHMAQIAAKAKNHIFIEKSVVENDTKTSINYLNEEGRILEIARLLSGGANMEKAVELATEMLTNK
jgi:DNA repair protein RecN (Recombination protein N)